MKRIFSQLILSLVLFSTFSSVASAVEFSVLPTLPPHLSTDDVWLTQGVPISSSNTEPSFKFYTKVDGTILYSGSCSSSDISAAVGEKTVTLNELAPGTYSDCSFKIYQLQVFPSIYYTNEVTLPTFTITAPSTPDTTAPVLTLNSSPSGEVNDTEQNLNFTTSEAGTYDFKGSCVDYATNNFAPYNITAGSENILLLFNLDYGTYDDCQITVTDASNNTSDVLAFPTFTVVDPNAADTTPPQLTLVTTFATPTDNHSPSFVINSNEAGTLNFYGSCSSTATSISTVDKTITLNYLAEGTYNNCSLSVTDSSGNESTKLSIPSFTISDPVITTPTTKCADYTDISESDSDCDAITYAKNIGAMTGNPDGTFDPSGLLQRDQIAKIALETFNHYTSGSDYCDNTNPFPDVTQSAWSYQYVCRAKSLNVITGYEAGVDAGYFRPARSVNRAEFLAIILRNLNETMPSGSSYSDVSSTDWFYGYARYSKVHDLFTGTYLYPASKVSRREVAATLYTLHQDGVI